MSRLSQAVGSTVGKKIIIGVTGVMLVGFVITHLLGNLLIFSGAEAFNAYAEGLEHIPGFPLIELGLLGLFFTHIAATASLTMANRKARPQAYANNASPTKTSSAWMIVSGSIVLLFLVVHLKSIRFNDLRHTEGVFKVTMDVMANPLTGGLYMIGVVLLGFHLSHGIQALFRTMGFSDKERFPAIEAASKGLAAVITLGFLSLPIYAMLQ